MTNKYTEFVSNPSTQIDGQLLRSERITKLTDDDYQKVGVEARLADYTYVLGLIDKLAGRSYTLIEACISDKEQQKACKDTLRGIVAEQTEKAYQDLVQGK